MAVEPERTVPLGAYEHLVTSGLLRSVGDPDRSFPVFGDLDKADAPTVLARHIAALSLRVLRSVRGEDALAGQVQLANQVVAALRAAAPQVIDGGDDDVDRAQLLLALLGPTPAPFTPAAPARPEVPLAASALLVNGIGQPRIGTEVAAELASADTVDLICAFVKWHGLRVLQPALHDARRRGVPIRVITTTYMGATDRRALDALADMGAEIKVSYDTRSTRLHAKAWLFQRHSGASTAYIGSSNLSRAALLDGLEWNVRLAALEQPHLLDIFAATFENYWQDPAFETYDPVRDADRFDRAVREERHGDGAPALILSSLDVQPYGYQREILDALEAERVLHDRWRNLVVAATGTGKTIMAALDYQRLREAGQVETLLFVAHREEILTQSLGVFRQVLRDQAFGEPLVGGAKPERWQHVFASVQSLARLELDPTAFDMVIVDEFHHAEAPTYTRLLERLRPRVLLGLTATPERTDGGDVKRFFDGRIAAELRLWEALERGLLSPFQYFGIADGVPLQQVKWRGGGYDLGELSNLYTNDHARVRLIVSKLQEIVGEVGSIRALGFCVSIAHAEFMAERFRHHGIHAVAVSSRTSPDDRRDALRDLQARRVNVVFVVDLFNEGVDVPSVDTVLFLRPTESATVFLQQLGRGLRLFEGKPCLTVLDFIGHQHARFRFDLRYRALTGVSRRELAEQVEQGFPYLPAGCHIELDTVAHQAVLANVRHALNLSWQDLVAELRALGDVSLQTFLEETGVELETVYRRGGWARLRREAGFDPRPPREHDKRLGDAFGRLLHVDDPERLRAYGERVLTSRRAAASSGSPREQRLATMLKYAIWGVGNEEGDLPPARREELAELLALLQERTTRVTRPLDPWSTSPLHIHARYSLHEALVAFGMPNPSSMRQGVVYLPDEKADLAFITLRKTEQHYSPTTRYNDYALSPTLFHWESQSTTSADSPTGQRYQHQQEQDSTFHLFIRESKQGLLGAPPYTYAGPATYVSHEGSRPMRVTWRLTHPLPPALLHAARIVAG